MVRSKIFISNRKVDLSNHYILYRCVVCASHEFVDIFNCSKYEATNTWDCLSTFLSGVYEVWMLLTEWGFSLSCLLGTPIFVCDLGDHPLHGDRRSMC